MELKDLLTIVGLSITLASLLNIALYQLFFLLRFNKSLKEFEYELRQSELVNHEQWKIRRNACFNALNIADNILSTYKYQNVADGLIKPGKVATEDVRKCFNELACSCRDHKVIEILKEILYGKVSPDIIVDLRNAVRKELDFGNTEFDMDRKNAFVGRIGSDSEVKKFGNETKVFSYAFKKD